jgi:regulator of cell morphogenesis and NO signaling
MQLDEELMQHLAKEEAILFPYIAGLEQALTAGTSKPHGCFGTVANPIAMMTQEHDAAGGLIAEIRRLSGNFTTPEDACPTFHAFYDGLREFEQDLHHHIHLENNILFPRAIELETSSR